MAGRPNLFVIGSMKSGTTSMHNYLDSHPDIAMSDVKEPGYFVKELAWSKGEKWYCDLFDDPSVYLYRGESSTHYTKRPLYEGVAERIYSFNPEARLIYIMRDPFGRMISHYWHAVRDFQQRGERRPMARAFTGHSHYLAFSDYSFQLEPYIKLFGTQSIYSVTFEELMHEPQARMGKIFTWLGLRKCEAKDLDMNAHNERPKSIVGVAGSGVLNQMQYSQSWGAISPFVPKTLKSLAKRFAYREIDEAQVAEDIAQMRSVLRPHLERQVDSLSRLLGREFPEWRM